MKLLRLLISGFLLSLATLIIVIGLIVSAARLLLPELGKYHDEVAAWVGDVLGQPVKIGALDATWQGLGPSLQLRDVTVLDAAGKQPVLRCAAARIDINLLESLRRWRIEPGQLTVSGLHLTVMRQADGNINVMGIDATANQSVRSGGSGGDTLERWLQHQERLAIKDSSLVWSDLSSHGKTWKFTAVNLQLRNQEERHRVDGSVNLPPDLGRHLQVAADVMGDLFAPKTWMGRVYVSGTALRLSEWLGDQANVGIASVQGETDFQAWSNWVDGVQQVEGDVHTQSLKIISQSETSAPEDSGASPASVAMEKVDGGFRWKRHASGWGMDIDNFVITHRDIPATPAQLRVEYGKDKAADKRIVRIAYSALRAEDLSAILLAAPNLPADVHERLEEMKPQGELGDGYLRYQSGGQQPPQYTFHTDFSGLAWHPVSRWPGAEGVTGSVTADNKQGVITLATGKAEISFTDLFRGPLPLDTLGGSVYWSRDEGGWRVLAQDLTAQNEDLNIKVTGYLDKPQAAKSPYIDLSARFGDGKIDHVSRYLPVKIMHPKTVEWLDRAIVNGRVSGGVASIQGWLSEFPFDGGHGLFEVRFNVTDGILEYADGWPRLEEIETEILFHGRRFEANDASAKSLGSEILQARVTIPDMTAHPALLTVDGKAQGPTSDAVRYVAESPLHTKFGDYLKGVNVGGHSNLRLSLKLPLAKQPPKVNGALRIGDGSLLFKSGEIQLTQINGVLNFSEKGLSADDIHADLLGQPVTVSAKTTTDKEGATTTFSAQGTMDIAAAAKHFATALAPYVDGTSDWHGDLRIPPKSAGWVELDINSSLKGVKINLPAPLGKTSEDSRDLLVELPLPLKAEKPIHIRYGTLADAQIGLSDDKGVMKLSRGEVRFNSGVAVLPSVPGVRVSGSLPEFDEGQWTEFLKKESANKQISSIPPVDHVDMTFGRLMLAGNRLDKAHLRADHAAGAWDVGIDSEQAAGLIHVPDAVDAPLVMNMDRLYLARFTKGDHKTSTADPRKSRPLTISVKSFHYGKLDLGELHLKSTRTPVGLNFDEIHTHSPQRDLKSSGQWIMEDDQMQSSFKVTYNGNDAGDTLTTLGFAGIIKGGKTHTDLKLKWPGAPSDFALAKANGSLSFEIKDGRLLDVEPGAGRILGLLSFQALPRHLTLDFSDLFQKGFSFDSLAGSFTIEKGNAYTDNLHMDGPAARIDAHGRVGLAAEDYDQRVSVIPSLSAGLPVAGALAGGVGAGAALLLVEKLIKPGIDKITKVEYQVTGPWANPTVTRITGTKQDKAQNKQTAEKKH